MHVLIKQFWVQILVCSMLNVAQGIMLQASTEDLSLKWGYKQLLYKRGWLRTEGGSQVHHSGFSLVFFKWSITGDSLENAGSQQCISLDSYGEFYFFRILLLVLSRRVQSYSFTKLQTYISCSQCTQKEGTERDSPSGCPSQDTIASHIKPPFQNCILSLRGSNSNFSTAKTESPAWSNMCEPEWNGDQEAHGWLSES